MVETEPELKGCPACGAPHEQQDLVTSFDVGIRQAQIIVLLQCRKCQAVYDPALVCTRHYRDRFKTPERDAKLTLKKKETK